MLVKENPLLAEAEALEKCRRVMELICEKCIKQQDMNEVLAMKMHYISCVLRKCASFLKDREDKLDGLIKRWGQLGFELRTCGLLEAYCCSSDLNFLKREFSLIALSCSLLKGRDSDGFPVFQEKFIRECIRKFPYCDATLLQQLVRSIAPVEIVSLEKMFRDKYLAFSLNITGDLKIKALSLMTWTEIEQNHLNIVFEWFQSECQPLWFVF